MYNQNDILAALQNGEDPQAIANAFANALNAAIKEKAEADKKAAEAAKTAGLKVSCMEHILNEIFGFLEEFYPKMCDAKDLYKRISAADIVKAMDEAQDEILKMQPVLDDLQKLVDSIEAEHPELKCNHAAKSAADPIEAFLKANGLKS